MSCCIYTASTGILIAIFSFRAVAMPDMIYALDEHGVDNRVAQFAVPFSVTLSANGSGVFLVSAAMFLANCSGITLNAGQIIIIG